MGEAKASGNLGNTLKVLQRFDEAVVCCQRHLDIAQEQGDKVRAPPRPAVPARVRDRGPPAAPRSRLWEDGPPPTRGRFPRALVLAPHAGARSPPASTAAPPSRASP